MTIASIKLKTNLCLTHQIYDNFTYIPFKSFNKQRKSQNNPVIIYLTLVRAIEMCGHRLSACFQVSKCFIY